MGLLVELVVEAGEEDVLLHVAPEGTELTLDGVDRGGIGEGDLLARARAGRNDLEPSARELAPTIDRVLAQFATAPGVLLARMSGSGATCFALFESDTARAEASDAARAQSWWSLETALA